VRDLTFGFSLQPTTDIGAHRELAAAADALRLDLVGIQDHPYIADFVDTFTVAGVLLAATENIAVFPDVANLPLRPPALLAKSAATLDLASGGRFELALGAGGYWDAITAMGAPRRTPREANVALEEAITIIRALWRGDNQPIHHTGRYYSISGTHSGPAPAHPIEIWTGAQGPRALALTGRVADGWAAPLAMYKPYEQWAPANRLIDDAAREAGRNPADLRRIAQIVGTIGGVSGTTTLRTGAAPLRADAEQWASEIARLAVEQPFTGFVFWPEHQSIEQIELFAGEVAPAARALISERGRYGDPAAGAAGSRQ